ncbi:MAG TPA: phosphoenolpyruvate carboxykinase (ATP) [Acidobacteriaceae bacterium]|jgi:phosphoenolpyruvate carboxykinase (ATP)|nr:phosphoenolpyruvate carboxykinase (ATP) [Acidobacteriaceae bacterium]
MGTTVTRQDLQRLSEGLHAHRNLSTAQLVETAIARGEGRLAANGALVAMTGARTGRSPRDKFTVEDDQTRERVHWGKVNQPFPQDKFDALLERVLRHMAERDLFVMDLAAGADPTYRLPIQMICEYAWHALFVKDLFVRPTAEELKNHVPEFTVIAAPEFEGVPERDGVRSGTFILTDFTKKIVMIGGTKYAGEMKKSIFGVMNYLLPERNVFPMHCSANIGAAGDTALFFGLSGTGKTTLSADPERRLIGDDEHGWSPDGVFNFEGGCYAKCVDLTMEKEPQIYGAIRFGSVLENVVLDSETGEPDYSDIRFTENTRAAYPIEFIANAVIPGVGGHPKNVLFLAADAFGVLPPIAKLTPDQAMYHFLSGYTAKLAGTEAGLGSEPVPEFSTCFGSPFLPLAPRVYAEMLGRRLREHRAECWLVNTGWTGGAFGVGKRMSLPHTRAMVHAALDGRLAKAEFTAEPAFGLSIPATCPGVPSELLNPRNAWADKAAYDAQAKLLASKFVENFKKFDVPDAVRKAGPRAG